MKNIRFVLIAASLFLVGCGGGSGVPVTSELKLVASAPQNSASSVVNTETFSAASSARMLVALNEGEIKTDAFTIESLKIPILDVALGTGSALQGGEGNVVTIYGCADASGENCMVELVGDALENLFDSVVGDSSYSIGKNTYTFLTVSTCGANSSTYPVKIKAQVEINSQTYYTKTDGGLTTTAPSEEVTLSFDGCRNYSILSTPITVTEAATVTLFADLRNVLSVGKSDADGSVSQAAGTCQNYASSFVLCANYPNVSGALGVSTPTIERYVVKDGTAATTATEASVLAIFKNPTTGEPFGGYVRVFAESGHIGPFDGIGTFKKASSGTNSGVFWTGYTGTSTDVIEGNGTYSFDDFAVETVDVNGCSATTGEWGTALTSTADSSKKIFACRLE